jgi:nucleotide-binding universal stress UspA family protein
MRDRIVVVGVDGSPEAQAALAWAVRLGGALGTEVVALHAVGLVETTHRLDQPADAWRAGLRDVTDHQWCARLVDARMVHRIEVVDGPAVDALLDAAKRERAVLVVVGARGVGNRPELALGSTSLRLLQAARVPTVVVPDTPVSETALDRLRRRILVGVDRSPASLAALAVAVDLAPVLRASLTVVEAFEFQRPFPLAVPAGGASRCDGSDPLPTAALVEDLVPRIREDGIAVEVVIRSGDPTPTLLQVADDIDADLVVVGSRGGGDPADPLLGSVARTLAARGRRPTLVVPSAAGPVRLTAQASDHTPIA